MKAFKTEPLRQTPMKPVWYTAREKFGPGRADAWAAYQAWARLPQLVEVVSLDNSLCPNVVRELIPEDWRHNVQQDFKIDFFTDLDYLINRVGERSGLNILAVLEEPDPEDIQTFQDERFSFKGFDLLDSPAAGISALVNCGGFDLAFLPADLNPVGLISEYGLARAVQQRLAANYPEEQHARCALWAIWRMEA